MIDTETKRLIEDAMLMKQNRADLEQALRDVGFTQITAKTPLSDLAKYMKWAGGLLDVRLATFHKQSLEHHYWTYDEWMEQSAQSRAGYIQMGVVVRAERQEFIVARDYATSETGATGIAWCVSNSYNVKGLDDFHGVPKKLDDVDSERNTDLIVAFAQSQGVSHPAAERTRAYACCSLADGGVEDPTTWSIPAIGILWLMFKYMLDINKELARYGMQPIDTANYHWSSTESNSSNAWNVSMGSGNVLNYNKTNAFKVRPVARASSSPATKTL